MLYILTFLVGYVLAEVLRQDSSSYEHVTTISVPTECIITMTINSTDDSVIDSYKDSLESDEDSEDFNPIYL